MTSHAPIDPATQALLRSTVQPPPLSQAFIDRCVATARRDIRTRRRVRQLLRAAAIALLVAAIAFVLLQTSASPSSLENSR